MTSCTFRGGVTLAVLFGFFGLAWMGDGFIAAYKAVIVLAIGQWAAAAPWTFELGIPPQRLVAMFRFVDGHFFIPTYCSPIAVMKLELPVTTKIDSYVLCHSFMLPGLVATVVTASTGLTRALHVMV